MKFIKFILTFGLLISCFNLQGQYYEEVVYLKNGTILKGRIIEQNNETIKIEIIDGTILAYSASEVEKITKDDKWIRVKESDFSFRIKEKGFYHSLNVGLSGIHVYPLYVGTKIHYTAGYQWKNRIAIGLGFGFDRYQLLFQSNIEKFAPLYVETKFYLRKKPFSPYYSLQAGHTLPDSGGTYIHSIFGFRFPSRSKLAFTTELGGSYQQNGPDPILDAIGSFTIRLGLLFG